MDKGKGSKKCVTTFLDDSLPLRNIDQAGRLVRLGVEVEHGQQVLPLGRLELELEQRVREPAPEKLAVEEKEMGPKTGKLFYENVQDVLSFSEAFLTSGSNPKLVFNFLIVHYLYLV